MFLAYRTQNMETERPDCDSHAFKSHSSLTLPFPSIFSIASSSSIRSCHFPFVAANKNKVYRKAKIERTFTNT